LSAWTRQAAARLAVPRDYPRQAHEDARPSCGAEELTPEERPFLRFDAAAQELFDGWRADLERRLRAEEDYLVLLYNAASQTRKPGPISLSIR